MNPNPEWQRIQEAAAYADLRAVAAEMRQHWLTRNFADRIEAALATLGKDTAK